jgi:hypothetical protein
MPDPGGTIMIDEAKLMRKAGGYCVATCGAITDRVLMDVATQYETGISQKFLTASAKDLALRFPGEEKLLVTTKYDGERVFIYFEAGKPFEIFAFKAPSGRVRVGLPALNALAAHLRPQKIKRALFRGELYLPGQINGKRIGASEVVRASMSGGEADFARLRLAVFDIIMLDGKDLRSGQTEFEPVWQTLHKVIGCQESFHVAEGAIVPEREVAAIFTKTTAAGQEGIVIRRLHRLELVKVKLHVSVDSAVVGYVEGEFEGNYGVLSLLTALNYPVRKNDANYFQVMARVGSGFSDQMRVDLLNRVSPLKLPAPLPMTDSDGRTVHFVRPRLIAEIEGDDIVATTREDRENQSQLLLWDNKSWEFQQMTPFPRMLFPIFSRLREDKDLTTGGARIQQVLPAITAPTLAAPKPKGAAKVLRREVYTKESKGETMVRKLVVVQTEGEPEAFPYVIYWTDFSAKRKEPLKTSVAYAITTARADALAQQFLDEGIVKGWARYGG